MLRDFAYKIDPDAVCPDVNGFTQHDADLVSNSRAQNKIRRQFAKTPYNFNIYVLISKHNWRTIKPNWLDAHPTIRYNYNPIHRDIVDDQDFGKLEQYVGQTINSSNAITVFFNNNITAKNNYHVMSGWILAHRIHHAMVVQKNVADSLKTFEHSIFQTLLDIFNKTNRFGSHYYINTGSDPSSLSSSRYNMQDHPIRLSNLLLTMRSARSGRIQLAADIPAELIAQYIITGSIKLNRASTWDRYQYPQSTQYLTEMYRAAQEKPELSDDFDRTYDIKDVAELDSMIDRAEHDLNSQCKILLDSYVGSMIGY